MLEFGVLRRQVHDDLQLVFCHLINVEGINLGIVLLLPWKTNQGHLRKYPHIVLEVTHMRASCVKTACCLCKEISLALPLLLALGESVTCSCGTYWANESTRLGSHPPMPPKVGSQWLREVRTHLSPLMSISALDDGNSPSQVLEHRSLRQSLNMYFTQLVVECLDSIYSIVFSTRSPPQLMCPLLCETHHSLDVTGIFVCAISWHHQSCSEGLRFLGVALIEDAKHCMVYSGDIKTILGFMIYVRFTSNSTSYHGCLSTGAAIPWCGVEWSRPSFAERRQRRYLETKSMQGYDEESGKNSFLACVVNACVLNSQKHVHMRQ